MTERIDADREAYLRDVRAEELLEQRPVCDMCGNHISTVYDYYFQIGKNIVCPDCMEDAMVHID